MPDNRSFMPFNIESHFLLVLNYLLTNERSHFFDTFDVPSEPALQDLIIEPSIQHVWKSAHIVCRAYENGFITIKGNKS
jgi:hypothetical protein